MRQSAHEKAAEVEPGGTLWFVFVGHGAPSKDAKDGVLIGVDAQQRADSLYARQQEVAEDAQRRRLESRDADWEKVSRLLVLTVVPEAEKRRSADMFAQEYLRSPGLAPAMARALAPHLPQGPLRGKLEKLAKASSAGEAGKAGIEWIPIPGGSFMMGSDADEEASPAHRVSIKGFQMSKTEVAFRQYRACVEAGACAPPHVSDGECVTSTPKGVLPASFQGDAQPVVCVDWEQAKAFAAWAGGRLPSEAEWEYAARGAGGRRSFPWGEEPASCAKAVLNDGAKGCGRDATWPVCSKPSGNTPQGLCDMAGNVMEWTQDWYHPSYKGAPADGSAWAEPDIQAGDRILRGGYWEHTADVLRTHVRIASVYGFTISSATGIRLVRTAP